MIDERREALAAAYVLGALDPEEAQEFERSLSSDLEMTAFVTKLSEASAALAHALPQQTPSPQLKGKILTQLDNRSEKNPAPPEPSAIPASPSSSWLPWALAACLAMICVVLGMQVTTVRRRAAELALQLGSANQRAAELRTQSATAQQQLSLLQTELAAMKNKDRFSEMRIALLGAMVLRSQALGVSLWDGEAQKGVLVAEHLAPLPADKDYQLWIIAPNEKPIDAGILPESDWRVIRYPFVPKTRVASVQKVAVTIEKKGGAAQPEGTMVLAGE